MRIRLCAHNSQEMLGPGHGIAVVPIQAVGLVERRLTRGKIHVAGWPVHFQPLWLGIAVRVARERQRLAEGRLEEREPLTRLIAGVDGARIETSLLSACVADTADNAWKLVTGACVISIKGVQPSALLCWILFVVHTH